MDPCLVVVYIDEKLANGEEAYLGQSFLAIVATCLNFLLDNSSRDRKDCTYTPT